VCIALFLGVDAGASLIDHVLLWALLWRPPLSWAVQGHVGRTGNRCQAHRQQEAASCCANDAASAMLHHLAMHPTVMYTLIPFPCSPVPPASLAQANLQLACFSVWMLQAGFLTVLLHLAIWHMLNVCLKSPLSSPPTHPPQVAVDFVSPEAVASALCQCQHLRRLALAHDDVAEVRGQEGGGSAHVCVVVVCVWGGGGAVRN